MSLALVSVFAPTEWDTTKALTNTLYVLDHSMVTNHTFHAIKSDRPAEAGDRFSIGIDVGGTKIAGLLLDSNKEIVTRTTFPVEKDSASAVLDALAETTQRLLGQVPEAHRPTCGVGFAVAGWLNRENDFVRFSPHLPLTGSNIRAELETRLKRPVAVANDADAAGWAEFQLGAARNYDDAACLTLGTGLGSAIISAGTLIRGHLGMVGELGHICIDTSGPKCPCGGTGCLEIFASGTGAERAARLADLRSEKHPERTMTGRELVAAAESGNPRARAVLDQVARPLAQALTMVVGTLDTAVIVIGGGFGSASKYFLETLRAQYAALAPRPDSRPLVHIEVAQLGPDAGAIGAALLA